MNDMKTPYKLKEGKIVECPEHEFWIRANDNVRTTARDIAAAVTGKYSWIDLACIGAACINQAIKSIAVARELVAREQCDLIIKPFFSTVIDDKERERTRIVLRVCKVPLPA
jgi:stage V sporulation protein SpoVS